MTTIPFDDWLRFAVLRLAIPPSDFWHLSLTEWRVLTQSASAPPLRRDELCALLKSHPDKTHDI
ncbi:phage tail assembly chaperone [Hyphobacterium indicum]|uniref:phage tail assembly chaperone n=1 Tax=Hyphobacterium indicum TaxID=2162714 RepID=UPI001F17A4B2|nr:phage tail assembly chaperone [Hyphobacterium indicum]